MTNNKTKYPIILVHGMVAKDFKFLRAFRIIKEELIKNGYEVFVSDIDGIGSIENNAIQLKEEILKILKDNNYFKINIIAHSKGGLDSRYMISKLEMDEFISSLTTLSTPHHGSKTSRKLLKLPKFIKRIIAFFANFIYKFFKDKNPDLLKVAEELQDTEMVKFNLEVKDSSKVYYQSYSSEVFNKIDLMFVPHIVTKYLEEENTDGIVSVSSAKRTNYKGNIDGKLSHSDMVGITFGKKKLLKVVSFYLNIIKDIENLGF